MASGSFERVCSCRFLLVEGFVQSFAGVCFHSSAEGELTVLSSSAGVYTAACIVILCIETIILFTPAFFHNLTTVCKEMNNCIICFYQHFPSIVIVMKHK
jgi:hypothetical protein